MIGVLAQRLVRTLCPHCKQPDDAIDARDAGRAGHAVAGCSGGVRAYKPVGCLECRMTGYRAASGLYESCCLTERRSRPWCTRTPTSRDPRRRPFSDGMRPLRLGGAMKVAEGLTTIEEVLSVAPPVLDAAGQAA